MEIDRLRNYPYHLQVGIIGAMDVVELHFTHMTAHKSLDESDGRVVRETIETTLDLIHAEIVKRSLKGIDKTADKVPEDMLEMLRHMDETQLRAAKEGIRAATEILAERDDSNDHRSHLMMKAIEEEMAKRAKVETPIDVSGMMGAKTVEDLIEKAGGTTKRPTIAGVGIVLNKGQIDYLLDACKTFVHRDLAIEKEHGNDLMALIETARRMFD